MNWLKIIVTKEQFDNGILDDLQTRLETKFKQAKKPKDMMVFMEDNGSSTEHSVILSPPCEKYAKDILNEFIAKPYAKPVITSLTHFAGNFDEIIFNTL